MEVFRFCIFFFFFFFFSLLHIFFASAFFFHFCGFNSPLDEEEQCKIFILANITTVKYLKLPKGSQLLLCMAVMDAVMDIR